ncbi:TVP38/TMEM64 family protein [Mycolicibacter minnesotensis]
MRGVVSATTATVRQVPAWRLAATAATLLLLVGFALVVPVPTAVELRDWAHRLGPWFPLAFLTAHTVVTMFPFPRTAFTLAAGLLFGPWLGVILAVVASTLSAVAVLVLMRTFGWQLSRVVRNRQIESLDARLRHRGWPAVVSLRLIPLVPFSVINYSAGASAIRLLPYTVATLGGLLPGTAALVVLGNALTGDVSPLLFAVSAGIAAVGVALLGYEVRSHRRHRPGPAAQTCEPGPTEPATDGSARPARSVT